MNPDHNNTPRSNWPWYEPYMFTGGVLVVFVAFLIACGILGDFLKRIPFGWAIWLGLFTAAGVADFFRKPDRLPSVIWPLLLALFFGVAAFAYHTNVDRWFGIWHAVLAGLFLCVAVKSGIVRHRLRKEQLAHLDQAVETLRRAVGHDDTTKAPSNQSLNPTENRPAN